MQKLNIGMFGTGEFDRGAYNISASFIKGLFEGFQKCNQNIFYINPQNSQFIKPDFTLSFANFYYPIILKTLGMGVTHMMWSIDTIFRQYSAITELVKHDNYIMIGGTLNDAEPIKSFYPNLPFYYLPIATDPDLWSPDDSKREHDIVFLSSLKDFEATIEEVKAKFPPKVFELYLEMIDIFVNNPELTFWDLYKHYSEYYNLDNPNLFIYFIDNSVYVATYLRRIKMIRQLKDFNVKIWGSPLWEKYIEGKVQYMGSADILEAIEIMRRSKIALSLQTMQGQLSLTERVVNSISAKSLVMSDHNAELKRQFPETIVYYDNVSMEDLPDLVSHYLTHNDEREERTARGRQQILQNHTWECRAKYILKNLLNIDVE